MDYEGPMRIAGIGGRLADQAVKMVRARNLYRWHTENRGVDDKRSEREKRLSESLGVLLDAIVEMLLALRLRQEGVKTVEEKPRLTDEQLFAGLTDAQLAQLMVTIIRFRLEKAKAKGEEEEAYDAVQHVADELLRREAAKL